MALKAMNLKLEESRIFDVKSVASLFHKTITEVVNEALEEYLANIKKDPFYRLAANIKNASEGESKEILSQIEMLSNEDLQIARVSKFKV